MQTRSCVLLAFSPFLFSLTGFAQSADTEIQAMRSEFAKAAKSITFTHAETNRTLRLMEKPAMTWSNPERRSPGGVFYLSLLDARPHAAMCIYPTSRGRFDIEFQSLSKSPLVASENGNTIWQPREAGIQWQTFQATQPSASLASTRLVQMRRLARTFSARLTIPNDADKPLRLLPTPVYRYDPKSLPKGVVDGAVFAFVLGTDPEILLMIESVEAAGGDTANPSDWRYALARMTVVSTQVERESQPVWKSRWGGKGINATYFSVQRGGDPFDG